MSTCIDELPYCLIIVVYIYIYSKTFSRIYKCMDIKHINILLKSKAF